MLFPAFRHEVTRAFGNEGERNEEDRRGDRLHQEHPAPGRDPAPEGCGRHARGRGEEVIDNERDRQADDDHDLLDAGQPAPDARRSDLRDIGRREDARRAHRHSARKPGDDEQHMRVGQALDQRPAEEQQGSDHHRVAAAHDVRQPSGEEGADEAADQQRPDGEPKSGIAEVERAAQAALSAIHGAAVIAEQEPADRRNGDDGPDETHVRARATRFGHWPALPSKARMRNRLLPGCR